jgi:hypothetical protein
MEIEEIVKIAKDVLQETGRHTMQLVVETSKINDDGTIENELHMVIVPSIINQAQKDEVAKYLRPLISDFKAERYFHIMEAWMSIVDVTKKMFRPASRDIDRKECLVISEYRKDQKNQSVTIPFIRANDGEIYVGRERRMTPGKDIWNAYLEFDGVEESLKKSVDEWNDAFFKSKAKEFTKKYHPKFVAATSDEERKNILREMMSEMKEEATKQKKTMLEDTEAEDDQ